MGDADSIDTHAMRRAGAALATRSAKDEKVATTLLDAAPDSLLDRAEAAQALRRKASALGSYQFLTYKSGRQADSPGSRVQVLGQGQLAKVRDGLWRRVCASQQAVT